MAYITREDGERFVIPSYRDVLSAKQKSTLKKEILALSESYGAYITMQRKNSTQYEIAFSPDPGYLLGESIWQYFKRPADLVYCEAVPNTTEAILVIVKAGSVYLDGRFPIESIPEELVVFLTETNHFDIYINGAVPISKVPEEGKFTFDTASVNSFTVLDKPVFPTLPLMKAYQLQLVDQVLKAQGIGVFPIKQAAMVLAVIVLGWMAWSYLSEQAPPPPPPQQVENPYAAFYTALSSPAPDQEIKSFLTVYNSLFGIAGWHPKIIKYGSGSLSASMLSDGGKVQKLFQWATANNATPVVDSSGIKLTLPVPTTNRAIPKNISVLNDVIASIVDNLNKVYPGNHLTVSEFKNQGVFTSVEMTLNIENGSPLLLDLIRNQFTGLPLVLNEISLNITNGVINGTITFQGIGK